MKYIWVKKENKRGTFLNSSFSFRALIGTLVWVLKAVSNSRVKYFLKTGRDKKIINYKLNRVSVKSLNIYNYISIYESFTISYCLTYSIVTKRVLSSRNTPETYEIPTQPILGIRGHQLHENSYSPGAVSSANYIFTNKFMREISGTNVVIRHISAKDGEIPLVSACICIAVCSQPWFY